MLPHGYEDNEVPTFWLLLHSLEPETHTVHTAEMLRHQASTEGISRSFRLGLYGLHPESHKVSLPKGVWVY